MLKERISGVNWIKERNKWRSSVSVKGDFYLLGYNDNYDDAVLLRKQAELILQGSNFNLVDENYSNLIRNKLGQGVNDFQIPKKKKFAKPPLCHPDKKLGGHGLCIACYTKKKRHENPEYYQRVLAQRRRIHHNKENVKVNRKKEFIRRKYKLEYETYLKMIENQNNLCYICNSPPKDPILSPLHIDHCHTTGKIRGLLCGKCNKGIGMFNDNINLFEKVIEYLKK